MIRLFFVTTLCTLFFSFTFLVAAEDNQTEDAAAASTPQTPLKTVPIAEVEQTPGQRLCQRQATILTRNKFVEVLGSQIVDGWGVNWEVFQNESLPFEHSLRIQAIRTINNRLTNLLRTNSDDDFINLFGQFSTIRAQIEAVHADRLDNLALAYFRRLFLTATLTPEMKLGGVQLGERIVVSQLGHPPLTYHVKTHSAGRLSSKSTAAKLVNPQELMAYRVLQYLGVGCDSHFFQRSPEDVYIATLDAGTGGTFCLFGVVSGNLGFGGDESVGRRFSGTLIDISQSPSQINPHSIEAAVAGDSVAQNFIDQMARLDIITRICRLHDLLNNPGNFGFFESTTQAPAILVIDFRVIDDPLLRQENYDPFGGFLIGNGLYDYASSHKTMRYVLHDRPRHARVETARGIMGRGLIESLRDSTERAYQDVLAYLRQDVFVSHHENLTLKLHDYREAVHHNIDFFWKKLHEWTPEADTVKEA